MTTRASGSRPERNNDAGSPSSEPNDGMTPEEPPVLVFEDPRREARDADPAVRPVDLRRFMTTSALIQANSGGGKSYLLRYILEQTHPFVQQILFDLEGEFASLRERFEYVVVSSDGTGDLPANPASAALLCRRLIQLGASAILDLSDMDPKPQQRFTRIFVETLLTLEIRRPLVVAIDEASRVAPESSLGTAESTDAIVSLTSRARKRRICVMIAGHRLSDLKKGAVSNLHNKFVGRVAMDTDLKRAGDDLGMTRSSRSVLKTLEPGTFFAYGPAVSPTGITRVRSGKVLTTHYDPTDHWDVSEPRVSPPPQESVREILAQLEDLEIEAEEQVRTIEALREEVRTLRAGKPKSPAECPECGVEHPSPPRTASEIEREIEREVERRLPREVENIKIPLEEEISILENTIANARLRATELAETLSPARPRDNDEGGNAAPPDPGARKPPRSNGASPGEESANGHGDENLPDAQKRILGTLAYLKKRGVDGLARSNLAVLSRQSPRSSSYEDHVASLKKAGLIRYPSPGVAGLTERGEKLARTTELPIKDSATPASLAELHADWSSYLPSAQGRMLGVLTRRYPEEISREELAGLTNQSPNSSSFDDNVAALGPRGLGLLEYPRPRHVKASGLLFPPELP